MGVPSVKLPLKSLLFIMPFNFGSYYQQWYKQMYILKIVMINWQSASWFMKCMATNIWYWRKYTSPLHPFVQLPTTSSSHAPEGKETSITVY